MIFKQLRTVYAQEKVVIRYEEWQSTTAWRIASIGNTIWRVLACLGTQSFPLYATVSFSLPVW